MSSHVCQVFILSGCLCLVEIFRTDNYLAAELDKLNDVASKRERC